MAKQATHRKLRQREALCGAYETTIGDQVIYGSGLTFCRKTSRPTCTPCAKIEDERDEARMVQAFSHTDRS